MHWTCWFFFSRSYRALPVRTQSILNLINYLTKEQSLFTNCQTTLIWYHHHHSLYAILYHWNNLRCPVDRTRQPTVINFRKLTVIFKLNTLFCVGWWATCVCMCVCLTIVSIDFLSDGRCFFFLRGSIAGGYFVLWIWWKMVITCCFCFRLLLLLWMKTRRITNLLLLWDAICK